MTYAQALHTFRWTACRRALGWNGDALNLAHTIVDRHAACGRTALRWFGADGTMREVGFAELSRLTSRCANLLRALGVRPGDRVAGYLSRVPETLVVMLGTWKAGAVYVPIFTGFAADAIRFRLEHSGARVLCAHRDHRARLPELPGVELLTVGGASFDHLLARQIDTFAPTGRRRDEPAVILYTSGSTGPPKGVKIATNFPLAVQPYATYALGLRADDVFWPTGDPGWGYGLVCYAVALAAGIPVVFHEAQPVPELALARLRALGVTNLATTPTLLRGIMALGPSAAPVTRVSTCGEPLNAEVVTFFQQHWGVTVMDQYGSSEFGLPIGNLNAVDMAVKPGSMGLPLPGCAMAVVDDTGAACALGEVGQIGMRPDPEGYYSLGYWEDEARTRELDRRGWMTIGDLARRDADGYFWFEGRADDVIKSAGYRLGPFEIESAILHHPAVAEAAAVATPDAVRGHVVKTYVVLKPGRAAYPGLEAEVAEIVKARVGAHARPREVEIVDQLPKTESGKIQRFALRQGLASRRADRGWGPGVRGEHR